MVDPPVILNPEPDVMPVLEIDWLIPVNEAVLLVIMAIVPAVEAVEERESRVPAVPVSTEVEESLMSDPVMTEVV
jgi:hypothetical protein